MWPHHKERRISFNLTTFTRVQIFCPTLPALLYTSQYKHATCLSNLLNTKFMPFVISIREMICLQHFYNNFITNPKWQVVTSCYCWDKKVILALI